jgi:hypothetical protein
MHRSRCAFIARSWAADTVCIRMRLEWNENRLCCCLFSNAGISVSTVTFELGTTSPIRCVIMIASSLLTSTTNIQH